MTFGGIEGTNHDSSSPYGSMPGVGVQRKSRPSQGAPSFVLPRASVVAQGDQKAMRGSIFQETFVRQASRVKVRGVVDKLAHGLLFQSGAFILMVLFSGLTPMLNQRTMVYNAEKGKRETPFISTTPFLVDFSISLVLGHFISACIYGKEGVKGCADWKAILMFVPNCIFQCFSETLQIFVLKYLDGTTWRVLKQTKLLLTAVGVTFCLGRKKTSYTQWVLICAITLSVVGYCLATQKTDGGMDSKWIGFVIAGTSILCSTIASLLGDLTLKNVHYPLVVQIPQGRWTSCLCALGMTMFICTREKSWNKFLFGEWNYRVVFLTVWLVLKDWISSFVLKHLDSLWKALGSVLALCLTYLLDITVMGKSFAPVPFVFVLSVMIEFLAFAVSKREQTKFEKAKEEMAYIR